jgi:hypothetical protein
MRTLLILPGVVLVLVACGETTGPPGQGDLVVAVSTSGGDLDLDGYELEVDDRLTIPIGTQGQQTLAVNAGNHHLELHGIAANCSAGGDGTRKSAAVPLGATVRVPYSVICEATGVRVGMTSTGLDLDPNGVGVRVDDLPRGFVASNGQFSISRLEPGEYRIALEDIAPNCQIQGEPSQLVTVVNREMAVVPFALECVATTGAIRVQVTTTGADPDDEYVAWRNGTAGSAPVVGGAGVLANVPAGTHQVSLADVGPNCTIEGQASQSATVTVGTLVRDTAEVAFAVTCVLDSGTITVTTSTSGTDPDAAYELTLYREDCYYYYYCYPETVATAPIAGNGTASLTARSGTYRLRLDGVDTHCGVAGGQNPSAELVVGVGAQLEYHFDVHCGVPTVQVSVTTTGSAPDTEYQAQLWYIDYSWYYYDYLVDTGALAANGTVTLESGFAGSFYVTLQDVSTNCAVTSRTPETFYLDHGDTQPVTFTVACGP